MFEENSIDSIRDVTKEIFKGRVLRVKSHSSIVPSSLDISRILTDEIKNKTYEVNPERLSLLGKHVDSYLPPTYPGRVGLHRPPVR